MGYKRIRFHASNAPWRTVWYEQVLALCLAILIFTAAPASAAMRLQDRSLYMNDVNPGATTSYEVGFRYMTELPVGSVDMLFCIDPIPYHECVPPPGLDASNATLASQSGEVGFSILSKTQNRIILTRTPGDITTNGSKYKFDNVINPTDITESFSIRLKTHSSTDVSGPQIDFGSVKGQVTDGVVIQTQVPPMLIFCAAEVVEENCGITNGNYFTDMGEFTEESALVAQSQFAVGTNASGGFAIIVNGAPFSAGTNVIDSLNSPTESKLGTNQFGINLVANNDPFVGKEPEGIWANAVPSPDYAMPDYFKFVPGDVIAYSPNVSLMKKFTVSYIVNAAPSLSAGVYNTTITYIASGRF